ncbi:MAG: ABC transporter substrate-binding protein [Chloroflexi bacterium]|nr:ABC transporter substrate-binding protein [Chloroflexota bacterium]
MMRAVLLLALAVLLVSACREISETAPSSTAGPVSTPLSPATPTAPSTPEPGAVLSATPTTATHPPSAATATPVSQRSGRLAIATRVVLDDLDVHRASAPSLAAFGPGIVYSRLLRFASGPDVRTPSLALECDLCESWVWEDSATLRVTLRQGVRWQSAAPVNGRALSPHDVTASLMRQRTAGWPHAGLLANVASVAVRGNDVVFTLRSPDADFPLALADGHTKVLPSELAAMDDLGVGPFIGTGPWVIGEVRPDHRYTFTPNPAYFEPGFPLLESLVIRVLPEDDVRGAAFLTQSLDVDEVTPEYFETYRERNPQAGFVRYEPPGGGSELALNVNDPVLRDPAVRRALFMALDPWSLNSQVWHGLAEVTGGMPSPSPDWRLSEAELRGLLADPVAARELLESAGSPPTTLELLVADFGDRHLTYSRGIHEQLRQIGVRVEVRDLNPQEYADRVWRQGDFQAYLGPLPPMNAPNSYLIGLVRSGSAGNKTGYGTSALDGLVDAQAGELDPAVRRGIAREAALMLLEEGVRFTPAAQAQVWGWWPRVKGLHVNFANREYHFWSRVWVE